MTQPGIEPRSPGPLVNTLTTRSMSGSFSLKLTDKKKFTNIGRLQKGFRHKTNNSRPRKQVDKPSENP